MSSPARQTNQPLQIFLTFVFLLNLLAGLVPPGTVLAASQAPTSASNSSSSSPAAPADNSAYSNSNSPGNTNSLALSSQQKTTQAYSNLPLAFEQNQGQTDGKVKFLARGQGYSIFLTSDQAVLDLRKAPDTKTAKNKESRVVPGKKQEAPSEQGTALRLSFSGSKSVRKIEGQQALAARSHYFTSNDQSKWHKDIPTFGRVLYQEVYPGIDVSYYGNQGQLEYDFDVAPKADPGLISVKFEGADRLELNQAGELVILSGDNELRQKLPVIYQEKNGVRQPVSGSYLLKGKSEVGFKVGSYDREQPLVIDPVLSFSTYLGVSGTDTSNSIAVDGSGNVYITGQTSSYRFPTTSGAYQTLAKGGPEVFVTKLNATGTSQLYSTFLSGSSQEVGTGIAVDSTGNAYITGYTLSTDFPVTGGAYHTTNLGGQEAFVTKLNPAGNGLVYSTYLGGAGNDESLAITLNSSGNAFITGFTNSTNFPTTSGVFQTGNQGDYDAFVTKLNSTGTGLVYSTYLGGSGYDNGAGIAVDSSDNAYVTGSSNSSNLPTSSGTYQATNKGGFDGYVIKLNATGTSLAYSTYLGGIGDEGASSIALDSSGNAYVTGATASSDFPATAGAYQTTLKGGQDTFVTRLNATGTGLTFSTYLGGADTETGTGIGLDSSGNVYITGYTRSSDFPTLGAYQSTNRGNQDVFVTKLNTTGSALVYSTYLGGGDNDYGSGLALDSAGNVYVTGYTRSLNFPTTAGVYQTEYTGGQDTFITKLSSSGNSLSYSTYLGGSGDDFIYNVEVDSSGNVYVSGTTQGTDFPTPTGAYQTTPRGDQDVFVTKLNSTGTALIYSTYLGSNSYDTPGGLAIDSSGNAYISGYTYGSNFPVTSGAYQTSIKAGNRDGFVTKLNSTGSALVYSTYLGGTGGENLARLKVDSAGQAFVFGDTSSYDFPVTSGAYQTSNQGDRNMFITKLNASGTGLIYSTYLGSSGVASAEGFDLDSSGNTYILGYTTALDFPVTSGAYQTTNRGGLDMVIAKLNATGTGLVYSTYLGGTARDDGEAVAVDSAGNLFIVGNTNSSDFPVTSGAYQTTYKGGNNDAFVTKLNSTGTALLYSTYIGAFGYDEARGVAVNADGNALVSGYTDSLSFPTTSGAYQTSHGGGSSYNTDAFLVNLNSNGSALLYSALDHNRNQKSR